MALKACLLVLSFILRVFAEVSVARRAADVQSTSSTSLPKFLSDGPLSGGRPWGNADPAVPHSAPNTGKTRRYDFVISRGYIQPDGVKKEAILINGQFPGPLIQANWGDTIQVRVTNRLDDANNQEGASLHWHGLTQVRTPYYDGVPGVSQCPIAPNSSFTYTFQADQFGTSWYHSHYSSQYTDGAFGPMVIYGPLQRGVTYDEDLGPIVISDYLHTTYEKVVKDSLTFPPTFPNWDNNLINGRDQSNASTYTFQPNKIYRLRLINASGAGQQKFTIDNHDLQVIANDFVPVVPYTTKVVTLGVGQRTDILVRAKGSPTDAVYMRSDIDTDCLNATWTNAHALATVYYSSADRSQKPKTSATPWQSNHCKNDPLNVTVPAYPLTPPTPSTSTTINVTIGINSTGSVVFFVNQTSFRTNYDNPVLLLTKLGNTSYPYSPEWNVYNFGSNYSVRMVIINSFEMPHPMHLHGHNFWVIQEGTGTWDGSIVNPANPQRRDTHILQPGTIDNPSYVVLQWNQDNPGKWPLHCHTAIHISYGLGLLVMEQPQLVQKYLDIPMTLAQTCRDWSRFSGSTVVDQIDSGL